MKLSDKDLEKYSLARAIAHVQGESGAPSGCFEREISDQLARDSGKSPNGFFVPFAALRSLNATTSSAGGYTVGTSTSATVTAALRPKSMAIRAGMQVVTGLSSNVVVPRQTGISTVEWGVETPAATTSSQPSFGQNTSSPHRCAGTTALSNELLMISPALTERYVCDELASTLGTAIDIAAINGTGNAGQPLGLLGQSGLGSITFGGAATWAKVVNFERLIGDANTGDDRAAWVTTPAVREKWRQLVRGTVAKSVWTDDNTVLGRPAITATSCPSDKVIFGDWASSWLLFWGEAVDVIVDPYALKKSGQTEIYAASLFDVAFPFASAFTVSTDSGAQ